MADIGFANVEVLSAANTKVLAINNTRVSLEKGYGLMTPIATFEVAVSDILNALDVQPVKRGRWIAENRDNRGYADCYTCTNCNCYTYTYTLMKDCEYDYCPRCGARMSED